MSEFKHYSVLLHETVDGLRIRPDGIYVDGTIGGGGHALSVVKKLNDKGRLIGIDQTRQRLKRPRKDFMSLRIGPPSSGRTILRFEIFFTAFPSKRSVEFISISEFPVISLTRVREASAIGWMHRSICGWTREILLPLQISSMTTQRHSSSI